MQDYIKKPESQSRTLDSNPKASRQASIGVILQRYRERSTPRYTQDKELIKGEFESAPPCVQEAMQRNEKLNDDLVLEKGISIKGNLTTEMKNISKINFSKITGSSNDTIFQRRAENPYLRKDELEGWEITAHHIIPHTKLVKALDELSSEDKEEVLKASIPDEITEEMAKNLKMDTILDTEKKRIAFVLVLKGSDPATDPRLNEDTDAQHIADLLDISQIEDCRLSFFEWQKGNQFLGPNTGIRAEPTDKKDDIDTDGKYYSSLVDQQHASNTEKTRFDELIELGNDLTSLLNNKSTLLSDIKNTLLKILDITKDAPLNDFDASKWKEITDHKELEKLINNEPIGTKLEILLNRTHIKKYSFFKINLPLSPDSNIKYEVGEYKYKGTIIKKKQVKGSILYIAWEDAKNIKPADKSDTTSLFNYCINNNVLTSTYLPLDLYNSLKE